MHGLGNDFVIIDARKEPFLPTPAQTKKLADRKYGIGCDQLIVLEPSQDADLFMRIYNADASQAEACGNATRCVAHLLMTEKNTENCTIQTLGGLLSARRAEKNLISINMGRPKFAWHEIPLREEVDSRAIPLEFEGLSAPIAVNIGNPHCCWFTNTLNIEQHQRLGQRYETHPLFPKRCNIHLIRVLNKESIEMLIWERGVGPTLASGSSACAAAVAAQERKLCGNTVRVKMQGGEAVITRVATGDIEMCGPYAKAFNGKFCLDVHGLV